MSRVKTLRADGRWDVSEADGRVIATCRTEAAADRMVGQRAADLARRDAARRIECDCAVRLDQGDWLQWRGGWDWGRADEGTRMDRETAEAFARMTGGSVVRVG